jgi:glycerol-1-phosphate dehydrogenase [NAD(P)+]
MNGLVLSGASISLYGNSRPASGAEHHMSHYWETVMEQRGMQHAMHGEQVAVGTVLVLMLIEELLQKEIDFDRARDFVEKFDRKHWEAEIRRTYGTAADEVIEIENSAGKNTPENCLRRIDSMQQHWQEICEQLKTMPSAEYLMNLLKEIGCPYLPSAIGIDAATLKDTFLYCKEVRARYTVFQTVYDLGLLDELSDGVQLRLNRIEEKA